jgi:hypothetical protein
MTVLTPLNLIRLVRIIVKRAYQLRHIRLCLRMCQRGFHWTDFREILYWPLLLKSVYKIQICLKSGKNIRHFTRRSRRLLLLPAA